MLDLHDILDALEIAVGDGVRHRGEGLHALGKGPVWMTEYRKGRFGQFAP
jgi:hypothetical protein